MAWWMKTARHKIVNQSENSYGWVRQLIIEASVAQRWPWMIHPNVFVFNLINFLLGCSSVAYGWIDQCGSGSLYCRHHIYVWFRVGCSCCPPFYDLACSLLQPSVCLPRSWGVVLEHLHFVRSTARPFQDIVSMSTAFISLTQTSLYRRWGRPVVLFPNTSSP